MTKVAGEPVSHTLQTKGALIAYDVRANASAIQPRCFL